MSFQLEAKTDENKKKNFSLWTITTTDGRNFIIRNLALKDIKQIEKNIFFGKKKKILT